ncbi:MAG: metal dependent phosphohydrolase [uncultured bacterium (gcode 4)]|uniref:Metal dependent phosphohydrolase n=1 Tax=uncultured bacterium (gcode 4) TaxID=1234023 RepID=K2GH41_9BACT|nr:MAG: metal dependent phosphohydrolase [uncultured bacterium (gcode 4)]
MILLDYIKKEFYYKNTKINAWLLNKVFENPKLKPFIYAYQKKQISNLYKNKVEPFWELSYLLCTLWMPYEYNIIDDMYTHDFEGIGRFLESKIKILENNPTQFEIDEFCAIMDIANQITNILSINAEDKIKWLCFFNKILHWKTKEAIERYIASKGVVLKTGIQIQSGVDYVKWVGDSMKWEDLSWVKKLQNILWKYLCNYAATLEYITTDNASQEDIDWRIWNILKKIMYWFSIRETSDFWDKQWAEHEEARLWAELVRDGNVAFSKLIKIKKLEQIWVEDRQNTMLKFNCIDDLIAIYNWMQGFSGMRFQNEDEVMEHFIWENKPSYNQIIIIYKLILFCKFKPEVLTKLIKHLINNVKSRSTFFEKFKIKTIEQILLNFSQDNEIYKKDECMTTFWLIEGYINQSNKENLIYNYWKLYLSLALNYSLAKSDETIEKSQKLLHIFLEKYWNNLPIELTSLIERVYSNIAIFETEHTERLSWITEKAHFVSKWKRLYERQKKNFLLEERENLMKWIMKIIGRLQKNVANITKYEDIELIQKEICKLIETSVYHNLCKITIEPKGKVIKPWKLKKHAIIDSDYFDIVFVYDEIYDYTFNKIFESEKDNIKWWILQLLDLYESFANNSQNLGALTQLAWMVFERKDEYTKGHVTRVEKLSLIIWGTLWLSPDRLLDLKLQAFYHDYWKYLVPDEILKNPWKLCQEEIVTMAKHSWDWVMLWIGLWLNIKYLEWMPHHSKFYSNNGDPSLRFVHLVTSIKNWEEIDVHDFTRLQWRNIPFAARVIIIWDIIDAIASRRIYDKRAGWSIEDILMDIDKELIGCAWLKRVGDWFEIIEGMWKKWSEKDMGNPCAIKINWKIYIPEPDATIYFDPEIIIKLVGNKEEYEKIRIQIQESDKKAIVSKISDFETSLEQLNEKKRIYEKLISYKRDDVPDEVFDEFKFTEKDKEDYDRIEEMLDKQRIIYNTYRKKA